MAKKAEVIAIHRESPGMSDVEIADALGCSPEYIRATARRNGLILPSRITEKNSPAVLRAEARALMRRAKKLLVRANQLEPDGDCGIDTILTPAQAADFHRPDKYIEAYHSDFKDYLP